MRNDSHTHIGFDPLFYLQGWSPYCLDLPRLLREAEDAHMDRSWSSLLSPIWIWTSLR